jgi:hypothetical protein
MFQKVTSPTKCRAFVPAILLLQLTACAGYHSLTRPARRLFNQENFSAAAVEYDKNISRAGNEQLLALLDTAISYHYAGQYQKSIHYFLEADKLAQRLDYLSLSRQLTSLVATDYALKYKGEDFEKVLINTYLAIDYLMLGDLENALVEARRVNQKLKRYSQLCKCDYKLNPFSIYLSGIIYEMNGQPDEAYIDYKKVYQLSPGFPLLKNDLLRTSRLAGIEAPEAKNWRATSGGPDNSPPEGDYGELIVLFECGLSPEKHQETRIIAIPVYHKRPTRISYAQVYVDGRYYDRTYVLNDIEAIAIRQLKEKMLRILAKQSLVTTGKAAIAHQIGKQAKSPLVESLALMFFYATNKADTRSWLTLPQNIQLTRIALSPGRHEVTLKLYDHHNNLVKSVNYGNITIEKNGKRFINYRSVR